MRSIEKLRVSRSFCHSTRYAYHLLSFIMLLLTFHRYSGRSLDWRAGLGVEKITGHHMRTGGADGLGLQRRLSVQLGRSGWDLYRMIARHHRSALIHLSAREGIVPLQHRRVMSLVEMVGR